MAKRFTGGGARVRHKPTISRGSGGGLAAKPAAPKGVMQTIEGKAMIVDRLPRKKR